MERRDFTSLLMSLTSGALLAPLAGKTALLENRLPASPLGLDTTKDLGLPLNLPENIAKLVKNTMKQQFQAVNTDWDGSIQIEGLLRFARRGYRDGGNYALNWFNYHVEHDGKLTDQEYYKQYSGPKVRILRDGPLAFVIYSATLGVAFPVHELYLQTHNKQAKQVCFDVADAILHYAARDRFGMLAHDDINFTNFAIPDTAYWATRANAIAASLCTDKLQADVYWKQSIYQLNLGIKYFLDTDKGIVRTGLFKGEPGKTYWCRSQGWLIWAIAGLLRYLPPAHQAYKPAVNAMKMIANGAAKYQGPKGGLHVLVDDPASPEEVTSIAMVVAAVREGMRKGWLPKDYHNFCEKGWDFIKNSVDSNGTVHNAYTGWAVPAEARKVDLMDQEFRGYVPGIIMVAADEMTRAL